MVKNNEIPGNSNRSIWDIINSIYLTDKEEHEIKKYVEKKYDLFEHSLSKEAADRLYEMGVKWFKIGSGECSNFPFIEYLANFKLPIILSTGMNKIEDIKKSVKNLQKKRIKYALLQCTSMYPTPQNFINLNVLKTYKKIFKDAIIGLSDHSVGNASAIASVALGARIIEKHFTSLSHGKEKTYLYLWIH